MKECDTREKTTSGSKEDLNPKPCTLNPYTLQPTTLHPKTLNP